MTDSTEILVAAGVVGAGYWYLKRRQPAAPATTPKLVVRPIAPAAPVTPAAPLPITRTYDALFTSFGPTLPTSYLRALGAHESGMRPNAAAGRGRGLFSIVDVVRTDFNQRHGSDVSSAQLLDPGTNIQIAADAIRRIVDAYAKNHASVANLREDWSNARFVELVTFGWNAGYSERGGVGRIASFLEQQGRRDITLDVVVANAAAAGASPHLSDLRKATYARDVTATYFRERARDAAERLPTPPAPPTHHESSPTPADAAPASVPS